jgi:hypothetical protein
MRLQSMFTILILGVCVLLRVWDQVMGVFISVDGYKKPHHLNYVYRLS